MEGWTGLGLGSFEVRYLRDKLKRDVDFLVVRDRKPWLLTTSDQGKTCISGCNRPPFFGGRLFQPNQSDGGARADLSPPVRPL